MGAAGTFADNLRLPVHRWFRYAAGYSAAWAEAETRAHVRARPDARVLDPFAGSGTTLLAADAAGVPSVGFEAQPFTWRVGRAKLAWDADPDALLALAARVARDAALRAPAAPPEGGLVARCFTPEAAGSLLALRDALRGATPGNGATPGAGARQEEDARGEADLAWLALVSVVRRCSHAGTAPWQYVLPARRKRAPEADPAIAFLAQACRMADDMRHARAAGWRRASRIERRDARRAEEGEARGFTLVLTSPPYANNFDYADAARLELSVLGEVAGWRDLAPLRRDLVPSCTQHVSAARAPISRLLAEPLLDPIRGDLERACAALAEAAPARGGRKPYDRMVAAYFGGMARHWAALARVLAPDARARYVVGDSAPYGVHVPTESWLARLAAPHGFAFEGFDRLRARNVKWRNRKHRVPLQEGVLRLAWRG